MKFGIFLIAIGCAISGFAADTAYEGYLVDKFCGTAGTSKMDGSNEITAPQEHTVACQIACAKGGYGVMVKDGVAYKFMPFDAKGNELATQILKSTKKVKGPTVQIMGTLKNGVIEVSGMKETQL